MSQDCEEVVEKVKARLQEEGREARNLVAYSLPLQDARSKDDKTEPTEPEFNSNRRCSKRAKRSRSSSAGRDPQASMRARHWGFLFRNLQQAVDEIYQTCEDDESIIECKEAMLMLSRYTSDFEKLIEWLKLKWEYENTLPPQRPTSLTWEIRTSSPGKVITQTERKLSIRRALNFDKLDVKSISTKASPNHSKELPPKYPKQSENSIEGKSDPDLSKIKRTSSTEESNNDRRDSRCRANSKIRSRSKTIPEECENTDSNNSFKSFSVPDKSTDSSVVVKLLQEYPDEILTQSEKEKDTILVSECEELTVSADVTSKDVESPKIAPSNELIDSANISIELPAKIDSNSEDSKEKLATSTTCINDTPAAEQINNKDHIDPKIDEVNPKFSDIEKSEDKAKAISDDVLSDSSSINKTVDTNANCTDLCANQEQTDSNAKDNSIETKLTKTPKKPVKHVSIERSNSTSKKKRTKEINERPKENTSNVTKIIAPTTTKRPIRNKNDLRESKSNEDVSDGGTNRIIRKGLRKEPPKQEHKKTDIKNSEQSQLNEDGMESATHKITKKTNESSTEKNINKKAEEKIDETVSKPNEVQNRTVITSRSAPTVNMNKASQVRQAYNQNKTPQKQTRHTINRTPSTSRSLDSRNANMKPQHSLSSTRSSSRRPYEGRLSASRRIKSDIHANTRPPGPKRAHTTIGMEPGNSRFSSKSDISQSNTSIASNATSPAGFSWADKVRGCTSSSQTSSPSQLSLQEDSDGWEIVRRGRRSHGGSTASLNNNFNNMNNKRPYTSPAYKEGFTVNKAKNRFNVPSAATSLPSLNVQDNKNVCSTPPPSISGRDQEVSSEHAKTNINRKRNEPVSRSEPKLKRTKSTLGEDGYRTVENRKSNSRKRRSLSFTKENKDSINLAKKESIYALNRKDKKSGKKNSCESLEDISLQENENQINLENETLSENTSTHNNASCSDYGVCINELPETSDLEDANHSDGDSNDVQIQDTLSIDKEHRSYDSDSGMDEEEMRYNAAALESAEYEERRLKQQIEETEKTEIKVEEDVCEEDNFHDADSCQSSNRSTKYDNLLTALSWADQMETLESLEELRHPGRVLHIHEKLSSPSRKLPVKEKFRRHQEKLAKAQELRDKLMMAKTEKLKDLFKRIDEVHTEKERLMGEKRKLFQRKMERAEEKRRQHLQEIVNKAHDEEKKAKEIAFINGLEAQNKLHDIMQQHQSHESRLADMAEERSRKQEEKAAKEAAAQERRRAMEAERQARMEELCEKRRQRCERIDRQQAEKREEMLEQAREKARDHKERLSAIHQAQQIKESELVKRIQQKQEESARRHEEKMDLIRQRALESSILNYSKGCDEAPKLIRYETKKLCTLCNCLIASEVYLLSHLRSGKHQEALQALHKKDISSEETATYNLKHIINAPANVDDPEAIRDKDRQKSLKKKCRKLRTRMSSRGKEYLVDFQVNCPKDTQNKSRISKSLQQINKLTSNQGTGPWDSNDCSQLDKSLLELHRILIKQQSNDQTAFLALEGFPRLSKIFECILSAEDTKSCVIPTRSLGYAFKVILAAVKGNPEGCRFLLNSNLIGTFVDFLNKRLEDLNKEITNTNPSFLPSDNVVVSLFEVCAEVMIVLIDADLKVPDSTDYEKKQNGKNSWLRLQDLISYCVSVGVTDKVSWYLSRVQGPVDDDQGVVDLILSSMSLIGALAKTLALRPTSDDPTQLIGTFHVTDGCGVVSLLYGLLLHQGGRLSQQPQTQLTPTAEAITIVATSLLLNLASLDLGMFQTVLGSEGISLEFRHIASYLLWYSSHWPCDTILHNIITLVGYFTINNKENQMVIQSGEMPSVLQQLINLPWRYFSEKKLSAILFPTLLSCCLQNPDNIHILKQDMSFQILEDFLKDEASHDNQLVKLLPKIQVEA